MILINMKEVDAEGYVAKDSWEYRADQLEMAREIFNVLTQMCHRPGNKRQNSFVSIELCNNGAAEIKYERGPL